MSQNLFALLFGIIGFFLLLSLLVRKVTGSQFSHYARISPGDGLSGKEFIEKVIEGEELREISLKEAKGAFSGSYSLSENRVIVPKLKESSLLSLGISAHELGHAGQVKGRKSVMKVIALLERFGLLLSYIFPLFLIGGFILYFPLVYLGLGSYLAILLICLIEMPLEINASRRALIYLEQYTKLTEEELHRLKKLLGLAILSRLTYITVGYFNLIDFDSER
ncbi:zinc metallopeptidase [Candidatus Bipolaricaulota bacterium]|nr:zinc metallopeptidase [Candidatus Bipolaricaulota bacterium]